MLKPFEFQPLVGALYQHHHRENDTGSAVVDGRLVVDEDGEEPETHLREHLHHEMRMREGSTKLLAASQHPEVMLEGAKSLLVSEKRMNCFRKELQRRKSGESLKALWALPPDCSQQRRSYQLAPPTENNTDGGGGGGGDETTPTIPSPPPPASAWTAPSPPPSWRGWPSR